MDKVFTLLLIFFLCVFSSAMAFELTTDQFSRLKTAQTILSEVDTRSMDEIIKDLKASAYPDAQLLILEAVARTYREMVEEYDVTTQSRKEWLHSIILLNMAYFQLGGQDNEISDTALNIVIRRKLKNHLPPSIFSQKEVFYSLDN